MAWTEDQISKFQTNNKVVGKKCTKCEVFKNAEHFNKDSSRKSGLRDKCIDCRKNESKKYYSSNSQKIINHVKEYAIKYPDKIKSYKNKYEKNNLSVISEKKKVHRMTHHEKYLERGRVYREKNSGKIREAAIKYREKNREKNRQKRKENPEFYREQDKKKYERRKDSHLSYTKKYRQQNKSKRNERERLKKKSNPLWKLKCVLRIRVVKVFKRIGASKEANTESIIGCSWQQAKSHIEGQFTDGMTWQNHGKWHIDHKIPLSTASTSEQLSFLCHYTNLQPLWRLDNLKKGNKTSWVKQ